MLPGDHPLRPDLQADHRALTTGFGVFDLSIAPVMIVGAIAGGFIGASLNKKCSEAAVEKAFNAVQLLVLAISIFNIVRNLAA